MLLISGWILDQASRTQLGAVNIWASVAKTKQRFRSPCPKTNHGANCRILGDQE